MPPERIFTFDIEAPHHMSVGGKGVSPSMENFGESLTELLGLLKSRGIKSTFFVVAELAQKHAGLLRRMVSDGHEVALHSFYHKLVFRMSPEEFEKDTVEGKKLLEDAAGAKVIGYRAPSWSAHTRKTPWLWEILEKNGFEYSSSIAPVRTPLYGDVTASPYPHFVKTAKGEILEIPLPTRRFLTRIPFSGGFYFRILPSWLRHKMERDWESSGLPLLYYFHLRDLGFEEMPPGLALTARAVNYWGRRSARKNFDLLLESDNFGTVRDFLPQFRDFAGRE